MNCDKKKLMERIAEIQKATDPLFEVDLKKWAIRGNVPSAKKPVEKLRADKHLGLPVAERVMHHLWKELPLEGVSYHVVPNDVLMADFSDMAPVFVLVRCIDEDHFDVELVDDMDNMLMSLPSQNLRQLAEILREMHEAGLKVSQTPEALDERRSRFFKGKFDALRRVCAGNPPLT